MRAVQQNVPARGYCHVPESESGGPACLAPGATLFLVEVGPGQQPAVLLALRHGDDADVTSLLCLQLLLQPRQVDGFRYQCGKPENLPGNGGAVSNHPRQKSGLAPVTHQLVLLSTEVQCR